jgi:hypothetical protein
MEYMESLQGQPQCRRKVITVGFPSGGGICNLGEDRALEPTLGTDSTSSAGGDFQDASSCWNVIVATMSIVDIGNGDEAGKYLLELR